MYQTTPTRKVSAQVSAVELRWCAFPAVTSPQYSIVQWHCHLTCQIPTLTIPPISATCCMSIQYEAHDQWKSEQSSYKLATTDIGKASYSPSLPDVVT